MSKVKNTGTATSKTTSSKDLKHKGDHSAARASGGALAIERSGAKLQEWVENMPPWAKRTAFYVLLLSGVYWILAGWFSSWGYVMYPIGRFGLTAFGGGLLYLAMLVQHDPKAEQPTQQTQHIPDDDMLERGRINQKFGAYFCIGGLALMGLTYVSDMFSGGTWYVGVGVVVFGVLQAYNGYTQVQTTEKKSG